MARASRPLVIGMDVGGTCTRVVVSDLGGRVVATARGEGGNPVAHGPEAAAGRITRTLRSALSGIEPARVTAVVLGLAGGLVASSAQDVLWPAAGLRVTPRLVSDVELAFAAGTSAPAGSVLLAGTGAVAAEYRDHARARHADGHGWLLGDRGSGFWLGRAAVELTLARLDQGRPLTGLTRTVLETLAPDAAPDPRTALLAAAYAARPVSLARLAPAVLAAADPDARALVERAADHLLASLATVRPPDSPHPLVLAGGVLTPGSALTAAVRSRIAARWPDAEPVHAAHPAGAAAWLAARPLLHPAEAERLHRRFTQTPEGPSRA